VPRVLDIYAALPSMTGKIELEYEGELKGGDNVARELIRMAVGKVYNSYFDGVNVSNIVKWFDLGGSVKLDADISASDMIAQLTPIQGLMEKTAALGAGADAAEAVRAAAAEFILEGLHAHRRINRSEERGFIADERKREPAQGDERRPGQRRQQFN
jgi:magnesium chelatase subunit I